MASPTLNEDSSPQRLLAFMAKYRTGQGSALRIATEARSLLESHVADSETVLVIQQTLLELV